MLSSIYFIRITTGVLLLQNFKAGWLQVGSSNYTAELTQPTFRFQAALIQRYVNFT